MNESLLGILQKVTLLDLLWAVFLISILLGALLSQKKRIVKVLNKWRKTKNEEEDFYTLVYDLKDSLQDVKQTMDNYQANREHDRNDSIRIRNEIYKEIGKQSSSIDNLTKIVVKMEEKNSKTKRAEIKAKIEGIYRECHPAMTCTDMALETLKELIEEYEAHGGDNSFVHSTVEPEMYEWKIINKIRGASVENTNQKHD